MNKQQAQDIIKNTFESSFDINSYTGFIKNLLNRIDEAPFTYQGNYIPDAYKQYIKKLERIGKFSDGENSIDILVVTLQKKTSLERARTMQRNFTAWYLNGSRGGTMKDAALVSFVSPDEADWRFSLVKMDYKFEQTKTSRMKVKEEFTPARRWSFLVGANEKSHTAQSRLVNILANDEQAPTLGEIENAFDIETVSKEFFLKYRELFLRTKEELDRVVKKDPKIKADFEAKSVDTVNFSKKLLGQIVFLYFLQKKGWFGVGRDADWGTGSKNFLRELFDKKHGVFKNFFNDVLEHLFYDALRDDRKHNDYYFSQFNCKIPFLNGGLFDPIGNYDWVHTDILLPDSLFSNKVKTKEGDTGDGILDIFDRYNFTVKEDEPMEKEVAIDPELLGKAYEKFNAIRPDNFEEYKKALKSGKKGDESKFNKQFGVYYTPREIVHYMCQQSLVNYLYLELNKGPVSYEKLGDPQLNMLGNKGKKGQLDLTIEHKSTFSIIKEDIENLIHIGEYVRENEARVLRKGKETKDYSYQLPESIRINAKQIDDKLADITVCDPAVGSGAFPVGMMSEIVRARKVLSTFVQGKSRTPYEFKRSCIEHSLYGVDIDSGAVEIAKLRLWLSLVVDEDDIKNIKPLPNLDYKVVCGNSLLGVEKNLFNDQLFSELEQLKPNYFNETNPTKKQKYKKQIDELISQITNGHTEFDFEVYFSEVFHSRGGFDIVIANPPYLVIKGGRFLQGYEYSKNEIEKIKRTYKTAQQQINAYTLFIERSAKILNSNGVSAYITSNTFLANEYSKNIRLFLLNDVHTLILNNVGKVFEDAVVEAIVLLYTKMKLKSGMTKIIFNKIESIVNLNKITSLTPDKKFLLDLDNHKFELIKKLNKIPKLSNFAKVWRGLTTGDDKKYLSHICSKAKHKKLITGKEIGRYICKNPKLYVYYDKNLLDRSREERIFLLKEKLVSKFVGKILTFAYDSKQYYVLNSGCVTEVINTSVHIKYLLALLNSTLLNFYFKTIFTDYRDSFPIMKSGNLENLPIIKAEAEFQENTVSIVDRIISLKRSSMKRDTTLLEREIDQMVYKLYDLTPEEITIVEGNNE